VKKLFFVKILDSVDFCVLMIRIWPICDLSIDYNEKKLQEYQRWPHFGDVIKLRHLNTSSKWRHNFVSIFKLPLAKSWLRPWPILFTYHPFQSSVIVRICIEAEI